MMCGMFLTKFREYSVRATDVTFISPRLIGGYRIPQGRSDFFHSSLGGLWEIFHLFPAIKSPG